MERAGQQAEISDFDYEHFCNSNLINCYYYRKAENKKTLKLDFTLFYEFFNLEYRILNSVASIREASFLDLFVDPSDKLR